MPAHYFCPRCGIHNRSKDRYGGNDPILEPLCPVCEDDLRRESPSFTAVNGLMV